MAHAIFRFLMRYHVAGIKCNEPDKTVSKYIEYVYDMYFEVANLRLGRSSDNPHG